MEGKYVIFDGAFAVCFGKAMVHSEMDYCDRYTNPRNWERSEPTSAGFFNLHVVDGGIKVNVHGRSESLDMDSLPTDAGLISIALGLELPLRT